MKLTKKVVQATECNEKIEIQNFFMMKKFPILENYCAPGWKIIFVLNLESFRFPIFQILIKVYLRHNLDTICLNSIYAILEAGQKTKIFFWPFQT